MLPERDGGLYFLCPFALLSIRKGVRLIVLANVLSLSLHVHAVHCMSRVPARQTTILSSLFLFHRSLVYPCCTPYTMVGLSRSIAVTGIEVMSVSGFESEGGAGGLKKEIKK